MLCPSRECQGLESGEQTNFLRANLETWGLALTGPTKQVETVQAGLGC